MFAVACSSGCTWRLGYEGNPEGGGTGGAAGSGGGEGGAGGFDWRSFDPATWQTLVSVWSEAAALGTAGAPTVTEVGPSLIGENVTFHGGALAPDGKIYFSPAYGFQVGVFDPDTLTLDRIGPVFDPSYHKWSGAVLAPNGVIYGMPYEDDRLLVIDTNTQPATVSLVSDPLFATGVFAAATLAPGGILYSAAYQGGPILKIDTNTNPPLVTELGNPGISWSVGAYSPNNGRIYFPPFGDDELLEVDPADDSYQLLPLPVLGRWYGTTVALDGNIYVAPDTGPGALRIDTSSGSAVITHLPTPLGVYDGFVLGPSGDLFSMPWATTELMRLTPSTGAITSFPSPTGAFSGACADGVLAPNGKIYAVPFEADYVLEIDTGAVGRLPLDVLLSGFLSTY